MSVTARPGAPAAPASSPRSISTDCGRRAPRGRRCRRRSAHRGHDRARRAGVRAVERAARAELRDLDRVAHAVVEAHAHRIAARALRHDAPREPLAHLDVRRAAAVLARARAEALARRLDLVADGRFDLVARRRRVDAAVGMRADRAPPARRLAPERAAVVDDVEQLLARVRERRAIEEVERAARVAVRFVAFGEAPSQLEPHLSERALLDVIDRHARRDLEADVGLARRAAARR